MDGSMDWSAGDHHVYLELGPDENVHLYYNLPGIGKWERVGPHDHPEMLEHLAIAFGALARASSPA